jgi:twitching motility protein PilT
MSTATAAAPGQARPAAAPAPAPAAAPRREPEVNKLFRMVMKHEGSDLHLKAGLAPMMRLAGTIRQMDLPPIPPDDMYRLLVQEGTGIMSARHRQILEDTGGADFAHIIGDDECRFRVNVFYQRGRLSLVARRVNTKIPDFKSLYLPPTIEELCKYYQGLVILAGVTGSGKSTTIASMLEYINQHERVHILTVEDPIEYLFRDKKAIINQREVGIDVKDWHTALKHAVREDPDIILVGEMRDRETFEAALHAAETGHLVFGTIHASSAASTIQRILDLFPIEMHGGIRQNLAFNLRAIICQKLLPTTKETSEKGVRRVPTCEIMVQNPTIKKLISEGQDEKLGDAIRIFLKEGMLDFTESLRLLCEAELIERATAFEAAPNVDALKMALKGIKVSTPGIL